MIDSYTQQFTKKPDDMAGFSVIVCTHAEHGVYQFYVSDKDFQDSLKPIVRGAWINGFVIVIYPAAF